ncbi:MAG: FAD-dependent oxidoreductase [Kiritimatiellae bacterium]|nr:FAD-dependent oxidoreductase [Kiritimatiellia bacterium]
MKVWLSAACAATILSGCVRDSAPAERDLVIYGSSPAALTAAIEAQRLGRTAVIVCPETRIGGLTTGGLGQTDIGNKSAFGGLALQFYRDVADWYKVDSHWKYEKRSDYIPDGQCAGSFGEDSMWTFEPSAALAILERWERDNKLEIVRGEFLDRKPGGVVRNGSRIVAIKTLSGKTFRGKMFVDATYEGDLMAAAGVSYTIGREANSAYGETISGIERALSKNHQFNKGVSPYVKPGDPSSGLLPYVEPDTDEPDGTGDGRVQAYCFRMCLTDDPSNRIPFVKPEGYNPQNYELLLRNLEAIDPDTFVKKAAKFWEFMPWINSRMPNRKTDTNNRSGFSTDFIGQNHAWPEASYKEREKILKAHLDYQMGLVWTLANNPRVPEPIRSRVAQWGTCKDEFADGLGHGWQSQLYVREARRMVGDYVATEHDVLRERTTSRPVAMAAYGMDSHHVRRYVGKDGFVHNEGNIEDWRAGGKPYPLDYGVIIPKKGDCENLFVPVCVSASHMAFGSIRMEPVFFALGQVAGAAAALSLDADCAVQDLSYESLKKVLLDGGQVLKSEK